MANIVKTSLGPVGLDKARDERREGVDFEDETRRIDETMRARGEGRGLTE